MRFYVFDSALFVYKVLLRFIGNLLSGTLFSIR